MTTKRPPVLHRHSAGVLRVHLTWSYSLGAAMTGEAIGSGSASPTSDDLDKYLRMVVYYETSAFTGQVAASQ